MRRYSLVLLQILCSSMIFGQDTIVLRNASLYIGQITIADNDRVSINYFKKNESNSTKVIKIKDIAYTSRKDISFSPQAIVVNGNETSQIPKATNIISLAKDGYFNIECRVSSDLEIQFPMDVFPIVNGVVCYTEVIRADSIQAKQLYQRAKYWFTEAFKSAKDVIQLDDPENGIIIGKGLVEVYGSPAVLQKATTMHIHFQLTVASKFGRYKYEIKDFSVDFLMGNKKYEYTLPGLFEWGNGSQGIKFAKEIDAKLKTLIASLKIGMLKSLDSADDAW